MKNISIWSEVESGFKGLKLDKNKEYDVVIVGGGITGISTLYHLSNSNLKVCLVEKNNICEGVTSRTTGKLTYLQDNIYSRLSKYHDFDKVKLYLDSQKEVIERVVKIIKDNDIDCNLDKVRSYVFTNDDSLDDEIGLLKKMDVKIKKDDELPDGKSIKQGYYVSDTYVFHPLKYLYSLVNIIRDKVDIYENTKIVSIDKLDDYYYLKSDDYILKTKKVVIAVHYPYFLFPFLIPFKSYLEKSYIGAKRVDNDYHYSAISISKPIESIRFYNDKKTYKLYLTNSHNYCVKNDEVKNFEELKDYDYLWSNKDIITNDLLPYIGLIDDNLYLGTGYNTWGMTNGSIAGIIISDMILNKKNKYVDLFNPKRKIKLSTFPIALFSSAYSFISTKINKQKSWYSNRVKFEKRNGKNVAIYIDDDNKEHVVYNLCPHLKCSLIFNEIEKTWDCPCHGSRFSLDGDVIEGPSNYDIKYKDK